MASNRHDRKELSCFCKELMTLEPEAPKWCATLCGHMYHYDCLLKWCANHENCPQCREKVRVRDIVLLYPTESDDPPEEDLSEVLQANLEEVQAKLSEKDDICKQKDDIIKNLKVDADSYKNFRLENEALKSVLEIFDGKTLEMMLDDPEEFDEIIASKIELIKQEQADLTKNKPGEVETNTPQGTNVPTSLVWAQETLRDLFLEPHNVENQETAIKPFPKVWDYSNETGSRRFNRR